MYKHSLQAGNESRCLLYTSDDTLLLESDIVFEKRILERVLEEPYPDVAVVDRYKSWMDGTMVTAVSYTHLDVYKRQP